MKTMHVKRQSDALRGSLEQRCKLNFPILRAIKSFHIRPMAYTRRSIIKQRITHKTPSMKRNVRF